MKKIITIFIFVFLHMNSNAQICDLLDSSFGFSGKAIGLTKKVKGYIIGKTISVQPDKKIVQLYNYQLEENMEAGLIRYSSDGQLDQTFGANGSVLISSKGFGASVCAIQTDGKILVAGSVLNSGNSDFALFRFNYDGTVDKSFGSNGKVIAPVGSFEDYVNGICIQSNGKILLVGNSSDSLYAQAFALVRYHIDGNIDSSFGQNGKMVSHIGHFITYIGTQYYGQYSHEYASAVAVQPDGKILVTGHSYSYNCSVEYYGGAYCNPLSVIIRYNINGTIDSSFGVNGEVKDSVSLFYPIALALQSDGKIVMTGSGISGFITKRLNSDGSPDINFGSEGNIIPYVYSLNNEGASSMIIQPDGKIIVGGTAYHQNTGSNFVVIRYNTNGTLDKSLNGTGIIETHIGQYSGSFDVLTAVALQDQKIIVGGFSYDATIQTLVVVRFSVISPLVSPVGPISLCPGGNVQLTSSEKGSLQWYKNDIPIPGAINSTYMVSDSGSYKVFSSNTNRCGFSAPVLINVNKPPKPIIIWTSNHYLTTTPGYTHYEWLLNGVAISGIDSSSYKPLLTGIYQVIITDNSGCKNTSDNYNLISLAATDLKVGNIKLHYYPNPAQFILNVDVLNAGNKKLDAIFCDINGRLVQKNVLSQGSNQLPLDKIPSGLYQLVLYNGREKTTIKISVIR